MTYLGGDGIDTPAGIAVDGAGNPYVAGTTTSTNFPTTQTAYQPTPEAGSAGTQHVFVTQLNNVNGIATALGQYSSYLSGNGDDIASGMTIDNKGNIYVTGTTTSIDTSSNPAIQFPASGLPQALPYQNIPRATIQFFVTKVNTAAPRTGSIAYSTYFGGGNFDTTTPIAVGGGIAVDVNRQHLFHRHHQFHLHRMPGMQHHRLPHPECVPALPQSAAAHRYRESSDLYRHRHRPLPMLSSPS